MPTDVIERKLTNLMTISDLNSDGVIEASDFEIWIERLAAIRGWEPASEEYAGLEALFMGAFSALQEMCGAGDQPLEIKRMGAALIAMSQASTDDLTAWADAMFALVDADGDGVIGPGEYRALLGSVSIHEAVADASFARLDVNGDGRLTRDEFVERYIEFYRSNDPESPGSWFWGPF